jgi:hypothetical protein
MQIISIYFFVTDINQMAVTTIYCEIWGVLSCIKISAVE